VHATEVHETGRPLAQEYCTAAAREVPISQWQRAIVYGNCSGLPDPTGASTPKGPARRDSQCVLTVREDFLEIGGGNHMEVLVSDLYIQLADAEKEGEGTLISVKAGNTYLANVSFVGNRDGCRGLDVQNNTNILVAGVCHTARWRHSTFEDTGEASIYHLYRLNSAKSLLAAPDCLRAVQSECRHVIDELKIQA
jgi:hypothetical protein